MKAIVHGLKLAVLSALLTLLASPAAFSQTPFYQGKTITIVRGSSPSGMVSAAILGEPGVQYDLNKFIYLGSPNSASHYVFFTNRKLGLGSMDKLRAHSGLRIGAQTVGHPIYLTGRLFAYLHGLKEPKYVVGYSSPEL